MEFLLDEHISPITCELLRTKGFSVHHIYVHDVSHLVSAPDVDVYNYAKENNYTIVTINRKHFKAFDASQCGGIIMLKLKPTTFGNVNNMLETFINAYDVESFVGKSITITRLAPSKILVGK